MCLSLLPGARSFFFYHIHGKKRKNRKKKKKNYLFSCGVAKGYPLAKQRLRTSLECFNDCSKNHLSHVHTLSTWLCGAFRLDGHAKVIPMPQMGTEVASMGLVTSPPAIITGTLVAWVRTQWQCCDIHDVLAHWWQNKHRHMTAKARRPVNSLAIGHCTYTFLSQNSTMPFAGSKTG